jgi:type IV secretion system protein VirB11
MPDYQAPGHDASVRFLLQPLQPFLDRDDVEEVALNRPGQVFVLSRHAGWSCHEAPAMDLRWCLDLGRAVATFSSPTDLLDADTPLLAATLPGGERVQFVVPPAVAFDTASITIRRPDTTVPRLADLRGLFTRVVRHAGEIQGFERELLALKDAGRFEEFLALAVHKRQTIVVSGHTGCGKTYIMKAMAEEIPRHERLVTIEDAAELLLPHHPNAVHLFFSAAAQGQARVTAQQLLKASLRMRPDRIIVAEVRDEVCLDFISAAASGHPGSMTSVHAGTCDLARERMALMIQQSPAGAGMRFEQIQRLLALVVDVIVQFGNDGSGRHVREVHYDPQRKLELARRFAS